MATTCSYRSTHCECCEVETEDVGCMNAVTQSLTHCSVYSTHLFVNAIAMLMLFVQKRSSGKEEIEGSPVQHRFEK